MKVVVIGGGIAGLALGIFLQKRNIDVVVNERSNGIPLRGHAFLMHSDGLSILNQLATESKTAVPGEAVDTFNLKRPEGKTIKSVELSSWQCMKRCDLIHFLYSMLPAEKIKEGRVFSHFIYKGDNAVAAVFENGEVEYGDIFVGADGGNSKVREAILGNVEFSAVKVKEVVGITRNEQIVKTHTATFTKFQHSKNGLSFGLIPTSADEFVWFMQYDSSASDVCHNDPKQIRDFCFSQLKEFPVEVGDVLRSNDFSSSYVWNTRDFDLLSSFHKNNVVLVGDAAHLALPFSSAGTTNAIIDAKTLAELLVEGDDCEAAFKKYYDLRSDEISNHIQLGRELKNNFLNPQNQKDDEMPVPLIPNKPKKAVNKKPIRVLYFTDPICSTCWIIEPVLRKLKLEYGKYLEFDYRMGGLLPSWNEYTKGKISTPLDAAKHWDDVAKEFQMPLNGDIWIQDPLPSSYPPSIAFKAAQMQDGKKALTFLRRIKEMVFLENKNISKEEFLIEAAEQSGLDVAQFLIDYTDEAEQHFLVDLKLTEQYEVKSFPTFFFIDEKGNEIKLKGYQPYERFEEIILSLLPSVEKDELSLTAEDLFCHFGTVTDKEFAYLTNSPKDISEHILSSLFEKQNIEKYSSKNGVIWKNRVCNCG